MSTQNAVGPSSQDAMAPQQHSMKFCSVFLSEERRSLKGANYLLLSIRCSLKRGLACDVVIDTLNYVFNVIQ